MINTKKIFITILVSALLLIGSALTVFAFDFSAPDYNDSEIYVSDYYYEQIDLYNITNGMSNTPYVGSFKRVYNGATQIYYEVPFVLTLSEYGFDFLSVNGENANSIKNTLEDFIEGSYGNIYCIRMTGNIFSGFSSGEADFNLFQNYFSLYPNTFNILNDINVQFFNYESQYQQLLQDYQNLQITISDLQTAINTLVSENGALYSQLSELQNQYNSLETQYNDLLTRYNDLVSFYSEELTRLLNENDELRTLLQNADTQINTLEYEINRLRQVNAEEYMRGYTQAMEDNDLFAEGLYSIFSAPFTLVAEIAEIEIFGTSIVKIVGIVLLFVVLSIVLGFLWKILPLV